jgi:uracil-DNA glycosylase
MKDLLSNDWLKALSDEFEKPYFKELESFLKTAYEHDLVFPPRNSVFNALNYTALEKVKVLIIGQDPYHNHGQAHGLAFSVLPDQKIPPSLVNIYKELQSDLGCPIPNHGFLKKWADQGILLLNTVLTVKAHEANSHQNKGWEHFTDAIIRSINALDRPMVILLWGKPAQSKNKMLDNPGHLVLKAPHPSPLSAYRGFFNCKHFSKTNDFLIQNGISPIDWCIDPI